MRFVAARTTLAAITLSLLPAVVTGCSAPWIVQGGLDFHDFRRPAAFVEGNTPWTCRIGSQFGWQPVAPPTWQPTDPVTQGISETGPKTSWVFRDASEAPAGQERLAQESVSQAPRQATSAGSGIARGVR